ncbi:unnamed protein product [Prunus armeniaca]
MDQQDQRHHLHYTSEDSLPNPWGWYRLDQQRSSNGEEMLSSRAEERQANAVPPCESSRSKGIEGIRPEVSPEEGWKPEEDVELVPLNPDKPERKARIGSRLSQEEKAELAAFLQNNKDVFAWSPSDMPGIDPQIICHRLHVNPTIKLVAQKRRNFAPERVAIIKVEIDKLLAIGFIEEVSYA